jgi:hypothetical protein
MLILATIGAVLNLAVIAWIRHLRARPAAQWRRTEPNVRQLRSERLQIALAILTLILVGLESWTHPMIHRTGPPPNSHSVSTSALSPTGRATTRVPKAPALSEVARANAR